MEPTIEIKTKKEISLKLKIANYDIILNLRNKQLLLSNKCNELGKNNALESHYVA